MDEGESTCIMSSACWKAIFSPALNQSPNYLEVFDGRESHPFGVLTSLPIMLEGKKANIEVEVIDAKLNYNLLLGRSWTHTMLCVLSTLFHVLRFPHEGKIIIVNQLSFFTSTSSQSNIQYVDHIPMPYESIGPGIFKDPTLMGFFPLPPLDNA